MRSGCSAKTFRQAEALPIDPGFTLRKAMIGASNSVVMWLIGVRGTKVDPKESVARLHQMFAELGPLMAASATKKREQDDG